MRIVPCELVQLKSCITSMWTRSSGSSCNAIIIHSCRAANRASMNWLNGPIKNTRDIVVFFILTIYLLRGWRSNAVWIDRDASMLSDSYYFPSPISLEDVLFPICIPAIYVLFPSLLMYFTY